MNREITRIIIGEDDYIVRRVMDNAFKEMGIADQVVFKEDGKSIIDYLENAVHDEALPSLVVLDLGMPIMSGMEVLERMKKNDRYKNIPVVICSNSINPMEERQSLHLGAVEFCIKPINLDEYVKLGNRFLEHAQQYEQSK